MRSRGVSRKGVRCWKSRSAKVSAQAGCYVWPPEPHGSARSGVWRDARQALDLARQQKARGEEVLALHQLGVLHAHASSSDVVQAEAYYRQALALAAELGMRPLQAHCHRGLGVLYTTRGQREQARAALATAMEMYSTMGMTFWLPQVEAALARVGNAE
jgi:TPR repeat protein